MNWLVESIRVARFELSLFSRFPKMRIGLLGIILIPALYAFIYLESVWDPASRTAQLPALIVNLDEGTMVNGQAVTLGTDLTSTLRAKQTFGFSEMKDADAARQAVREGRALFVLVIPPEFSAAAMRAAEPGAGKLIVYTSEGNDYAGAAFAKRFATELGHQLNETLNEKRWEVVLGAVSSSGTSLAQLRESVAHLRQGTGQLASGSAMAEDGADKLVAGARKLSENVTAMSEGVKQLAAGARQLDARKPVAADLAALKSGAAQLAQGHAELAAGWPRLEEGVDALGNGAGQLRDETRNIPIVGSQIASAAGQLADGASQLKSGLRTAAEAQGRLGAGSRALSTGVNQMADGFGAYAAGASMLASRFPTDARLDELAGGARTLATHAADLDAGVGKLKGGTQQVLLGLDTLAASLPAATPTVEGTPTGLSSTVQPDIQIDAPVANNGLGFIPNFVPVSLWLGAVMTTFIFFLRRIPEEMQAAPRVSLVAGKMAVLGSINLLQVLCVLAMCQLLLGLQAVHLGGLLAAMVVSSITFMLIILLLVRVFGDMGKAIALILLIIQLSSAGGVVPTELTSDFFRAVGPWLPFTWSVKAMRASAFGALGSQWLPAVGVVGLFGAVALALGCMTRKWDFVPVEKHQPAIEL